MNDKIVNKFWWAWETEKMELWLEDMSAQGWQYAYAKRSGT